MNMDVTSSFVSGFVRLWRITNDPLKEHPKHKKVSLILEKKNQLQYDWGAIAAKTIGRGDSSYRVRTLYIEYQNVASPGDTVATSAFDRDIGISYYEGLDAIAGRDYLRVPLSMEPKISAADGFGDYFTVEEHGNKLTFFAQTQGSIGVHGRPFNAAQNSKIIGAALVASPDFQAPERDLVFARIYFAGGEQYLKPQNAQVGVEWEVAFK